MVLGVPRTELYLVSINEYVQVQNHKIKESGDEEIARLTSLP